MKKLILTLLIFNLILSCSNDNWDSADPPEGQFRLVERICFCGPPEEGSIEYWTFDLEANLLTIRIVDSEGQVIESRELYYGRKESNILIGEGGEFVQKREGSLLVLTLLDDPGIADDELVIKLAYQ
ncbi:hypothetical protein [Flagellimonas sp.]|uniref:hypothetical protein n=1 Tax=Flagellimonas sp. TaxID=2058762 RepID=UPI003B5BB1E4